MDTNPILTDEELVAQYLSGEDAAFVEIVHRYLTPIYTFIFRLCGNANDAEEIAQESFLKVWKNLSKFRQHDKFKTWIYTIARNTTIDLLRKKKYAVFSDFDTDDGENFLEDTLTDQELLPNALFEQKENKEMFEALVVELPIHYREVILLHYHQELDFSEIATMLKKPLNTIKSQHRRALILLRKKLEHAPK